MLYSSGESEITCFADAIDSLAVRAYTSIPLQVHPVCHNVMDPTSSLTTEANHACFSSLLQATALGGHRISGQIACLSPALSLFSAYLLATAAMHVCLPLSGTRLPLSLCMRLMHSLSDNTAADLVRERGRGERRGMDRSIASVFPCECEPSGCTRDNHNLTEGSRSPFVSSHMRRNANKRALTIHMRRHSCVSPSSPASALPPSLCIAAQVFHSLPRPFLSSWLAHNGLPPTTVHLTQRQVSDKVIEVVSE